MSARLANWPRFSALLGGAGLVLCALAAFLPPGDERHCFIIGVCGLFGAAAGLPLLAADHDAPLWLARPAGWTGAIVSGAVVIGGAILWCGMRQFGGFDHSALIDLAWRLANGQHPYRDFPCPIPIGFVLGAGYAFQLFGVHWRSLVLVDALFAMVTFAWSCALLERLLGGRGRAWLVAFCVQATTTLLVAYWWYNPVTAVTGIIFILAAAAWLQEPRSVLVQVYYILSLCLLAALKPNLAGVLIAGTTLVLLTSRRHRWRTLAWSASSFILLVLWLAAHGLSVQDMVASYLGIAGRGFSFQQFLQDVSLEEKIFSLSAAAAVLAPSLLALRGAPSGSWGRRALAVVAMLAGLYGFVTNGEAKLVDLALAFIGTWVFVGGHPLATKYLLFLAAVLIGCGLGEAVTRHRVKVIGYGAFFQYELASQPIPTAFFEGAKGGLRLVTVAHNVQEVLAQNPRARVWFGPRMQWGYAAFAKPSPIGQPSWWHPGVSFPQNQEDDYMRKWIEQKFDLLIFLRGDATYLSPAFRREITARYAIAPSGSSLTVLRLKSTP